MALQNTLTGILARLFPRLAKIVVGGTITTNSNASLYPTAISNEILGGAHGLDTLLDLANIPVNRLHVPMLATVKEHIVNNQVLKRTTYVLELLPVGVDRLSDIPNYDISAYWKVFSAVGDYAGSLQVQYAPSIDALTGTPDTNGSTPPFPAARSGVQVTQIEYNNLVEGSTTAIASLSKSIAGYWSNTFDSSKNHVWQRQRFASGTSLSDWGIPVKIAGESYASGDYIANVFIRSATIPPTPPQFVNGKPNNNPVGWTDLPPAGTDKLWLTKAQKDVYGQLKTAWTTPIEIVLNPQLVRYNEQATPNPNTLTYDTTGSLSTPASLSLTGNGWVEIFDPAIHKFLATRTLVSPGVYTQWTVIKIADESGEYQDYVFKNFLLSKVDDIINNPDAYRPTGTTPVGWSDTPIASAVTEQLFVSSARKFYNGELINIWSDPTPFSGADSFIAYIASTPGDNFKTDPNVTPVTVSPASIQLSAKLYRGVTEITTQTYHWTKIYDNDTLYTTPIDLGLTPTISITPASVTGKAVFRCVQVYQGKIFTEEFSILDISDGIDAKGLTVTANANLLLALNAGGYSPASIIIKAYSQNLSDEGFLHWKKNGVAVLNQNGTVYEGDQLAVNYLDFATIGEITYTCSSVDGLSDNWTVYKTTDATNGAPATLMILSNETHTIVQDARTGLQNLDGAKTAVVVFSGSTDVTAQWTITKLDVGLVSSPANGTPLQVGQYIQVTSMPSAATSGYVTVTAVKSGQTITKQFSVSKIVDPIGSIIADIDSSVDGFTFSPSNQTPKILTANLYIDGLVNNTGIQSVDWYLDKVLSTASNTNTITITPALVDFQLTVEARIKYGGVFYNRTINITDVKDAVGIGIRYTDRNTDGNLDGQGNPVSDNDKPIATVLYNSTAVTNTGNVYWYAGNLATAVFMSIRKSDDLAWGTPIRIKGEKGTQGEVGHYINNVFQWSYGIPATPVGNPSSITKAPTGWYDAPPNNPANGSFLWMSLGEIDANNLLVGVWSTPVNTSGLAGTNGTNGTNGIDGNPTLSNDLIANTGITSINNTPIGSGLGYNMLSNTTAFVGGYSVITNNSIVTKIGMIKVEGNGATDGYDSTYMYSEPLFSLDGNNIVSSVPYTLDTRSTTIFGGKNSTTFQFAYSNIFNMFLFKVPPKTTVYVIVQLTAAISPQTLILSGMKTTTVLM